MSDKRVMVNLLPQYAPVSSVQFPVAILKLTKYNLIPFYFMNLRSSLD